MLMLNRAIRNGMHIGANCRFLGRQNFGSEPYLIEIGNDVTISNDVVFINHDGGTSVIKKLNNKEYEKVIRFGKIKIGNNCFIGARSILMPEISIGDNVIVGAGSIVTKDIPPDSVVAGVPAKVIKTIDEYANKCIKETPDYSEIEYKRNKRNTIIKLYR